MQVRDSDAQFRAHEAAGAYVTVNGERIFYRTEGDRSDGSPVVMLHGVPTSSYLYRKLISLSVGRHNRLAVLLRLHLCHSWVRMALRRYWKSTKA